MIVTNQILNKRREAGCFSITPERKYYVVNNSFIKRSLRPNEWQVNPVKGTIFVPKLGNERILNEAATLEFIQKNTDIPVPRLYACFEDDNAAVVVTEYISGVDMSELEDSQKSVVKEELKRHLRTLQSLRSSRVGGPTGLVVPPYRALSKLVREDWPMKASEQGDEYVFCHNDLSQHNVIVDPETLKINAIIDWEYAGFYPAWFEGKFFERPGPSVALSGEEDDSVRLVDFMKANRSST